VLPLEVAPVTPFVLAFHEYETFADVLDKVTVLNEVPEHMVWEFGLNVTVGDGLTVTVTVKVFPGHEKVVDGVTV
jgi:hypothetical protein